MRYFILTSELCIVLNTSDPSKSRVLMRDEVEVDPFSRVVAPTLLEGWHKAHGLNLTKREIEEAEAQTVAYTRAWRRVGQRWEPIW